ncbi:hypothetical protein [Natrialbaceae archaeon AArc-T1-2]|uniref:hypothetical protein n=1 Tax=Natrialbaceae archaeon AArc-T1-2 TaxID=3053904 RepID=UPI00255B1C24|nr:hypothetical protein [Natrialbaceae archaeon AArc-T1-2]WIV66719.1 hypothetical protein QQ977_13610 [Natrialbaceae archaeon AArc-T1-2]
MPLDVPVPDPPPLSNRGRPQEFEAVAEVGSEADLRRGELEEILQEGAWREAFEEWAEYTDLTETEFEIVLDRNLLRELDVFWDPTEERLRAEVDVTPAPDTDAESLSPGTRATIEDALLELGRTVVEVVETAYVDWGGEETDYVWDEETFGDGIQDRE